MTDDGKIMICGILCDSYLNTGPGTMGSCTHDSDHTKRVHTGANCIYGRLETLEKTTIQTLPNPERSYIRMIQQSIGPGQASHL